MVSRTAACLALLPLAGCGASAPAPPAPPAGERIACAPHGSRVFAMACTADRARSADDVVLTLRNPDGGFHRLALVADGRGVVAADGAGPAHVALAGGEAIEVAIGADRYRLPATVRAR